MRKWFAIVLICLLILSTLTGCTDRSKLSPDHPVMLTLWHVYGEQADSPMNRLVEEFNATVGQKMGILINVTNVTSASKIGGQLQAALSSEPDSPDMPDLFSAHTTTAMAMEPSSLVNWREYFTEEELESYVPEFLEDGTQNGQLLIFPVSKSSYALFINGTQFERFSADTGVTYDQLSTWEGFFDAAAKYYEWSGGKPFCAFDYLIRHVEFDILAQDGEVAYTEDGWFDLENPSLRNSWMKFAVPLAQGHIAIADMYANTQVMTGETLSGIGSTAAVNYYNDTVTYPDNSSEPMNLHVLPLPKTGEGEQYMPQTGVGLCAWKTTDAKAEAASAFVRWLTEGERNLDFVVETGYMPVHSDAFAAIDSYEFPSQGHASLYAAIKIMREEYTPVVRPDFDGFYDRVNILYDGLRQMQPALRERSDNGESAETLAEETWNFLCSIE